MRSWRSGFLCLALLLAAGCRQQTFDYYLFALSWSPEYCHSHPDAVECGEGNRHGFIVHGLWPQYNNGHYPEHCSDVGAAAPPLELREIMPDPGLIAHEWTMHGTCSGLNPSRYFALIRSTFDSLRIPDRFQAPSRTYSISPAEVKQAFEQANPKLSEASLAVNCPHNYLSGVEICVDQSGSPIPCPGNTVRDCRAKSIRVAGIR